MISPTYLLPNTYKTYCDILRKQPMNTYTFAEPLSSSEEGLMAVLTKRYRVPGISIIGPRKVPMRNKSIFSPWPTS